MKDKDHIIIKYLLGEATSAERMEVEDWIGSSSANAGYFERLSKVWQAAEIDTESFIPDTRTAWDKIDQSITQKESDVISLFEPEVKQIPLFNYVLRIAAILIIGLGAVWAVYTWNTTSEAVRYVEIITTDGEKSEIMLADGSQVFLNGSSKLRYPEKFSDDSRVVELSGEAFFEVRPNSEKPFRIAAGQTIIQVLGTSFNLRAHDHESEVSVVVVTGKVALIDRKNRKNRLLLTKGQKGTYNPVDRSMQRSTNDDLNFLSWQTGILSFRKTPLSEVAQALTLQYGILVTLKGANFADCRFTSTFDNKTLEEVGEVIQLSLDAQVSFQNNGMVIEGKGCQ